MNDLARTRTRYAPSPTGRQHVGGMRTALFAWLWARHNDGDFLLRIEDTDQERSKSDALQDLFEALEWMGLNYDEGPAGADAPPNEFFQTQRAPRYQQVAQEMVERGIAYECYCSKERLDALREAQQNRNEPPGYDRRCRTLSEAARAEAARGCAAEGRRPVVRFKVPLEGTTTVPDVVRGQWSVENHALEDLIIFKSDGLPTYHLGHLVDDRDMRISHVMRGVEYVPTAPLHVLMHQSMGWEVPTYVHLPLILDPRGGKLSKRKQGSDQEITVLRELQEREGWLPDSLYAWHEKHGVSDILTMAWEFRAAGFLPEALLNYLALLGWSVGADTDIATRAEMIQKFDVADIKRSSSTFDYHKLEFLNGYYIRQLPIEALAERVAPFLEEAGLPGERSRLIALLPLVQERMKLLSEAPELLDFFLGDAPLPAVADLPGQKMDPEGTIHALAGAAAALRDIEWTEAAIEEALRGQAKALGLKAGQLFQPIRVAVTGRKAAPGIFETVYHVGREAVLARLDRAIALLRAL